MTRRSEHIGFLARHFVKSSLPLNRTNALAVQRRNGHHSFWMTAHPELGLPYGRYPRLLLVWLTTQAVRTKSSRLTLGSSLSSFMRELGLLPTGGRFGSIPRLRDQMQRLFGATAGSTLHRPDSGQWTDRGFRLASEAHLWWEPRERHELLEAHSVVMLSPDFFSEVVQQPVPLDLRALSALRAPLAIDLYAWLTYRMSYLKRPTVVSWDDVAAQLGTSYARPRDLRSQVRKHAREIQTLYPGARLAVRRRGLSLRPSSPHVRRP